MRKTIPDERGACRGCDRALVYDVKDPDKEALYSGDGYCTTCAKWRARHPGEDPAARYDGFPPGTYRCPNSFETTLRRYEEWRTAREQRLLARFPAPR